MEIRVVVDPNHSAVFDTFIRRELKILRTRGMRVQFKEKPKGFFRCRMTEPRFFGRADRKGFKTAVANSVSGLVVAHWEHFFGVELINRSEWSAEDFNWAQVCARLNENRALIRKLKNRVFTGVARYLDESSNLDVSGFVRFRLSDVLETVADALALVADEQLFEQENEEFIKILKKYTVTRNRNLDTVHAVIEAGSRFKLYDESFEDLTRNLEQEAPFLDDEVRNEDLLITSLLTLAPKKIKLHGKRCLPVTLETLKRVFGPDVSVCGGCDRCAIWIKA